MDITAEMIKKLRDATGISIGKCKEALVEASGDMEKARQILQEYSAKAAAKKADRELGAGIVVSYVHSNGLMGTILSLQCETDFVAKNVDFVNIANDIAMHATAMQSAIDSIRDEQFVKNPEITIGQLIEQGTQKLGERIEIGDIRTLIIGE